MSADVASAPAQSELSNMNTSMSPTSATSDKLSKVDSAIEEGDHIGEAFKPRRRTSSTVTGVFSINELEKDNIDLQVAPETQKLNWKVNTSSGTIEDRDFLQKLLITPPVKKMDICTDLGLTMTARNLKGVTIKDACDAIYKQYKKKSDDELTDGMYLKGFEWDRENHYSSLIIHFKKSADVVPGSGKQRKKSRSGSVAEPVPE